MSDELITVTIDGVDVEVPKGTLAIRAAEAAGTQIPRFCDHPLLDPAGACRQCLVEVPDAGNGRPMPMPMSSCTLECAPGMKIDTQKTSANAKSAQEGVLEFLLLNHPLDCPICDKAGECPLQNQAMEHGQAETRYAGAKRKQPKPVPVSPQILIDRERCVLCTRCTRFADQIAGDPFVALAGRGAGQHVGTFGDDPSGSYFSGNIVQLCPVGALTSKSYRFASRPFDLVSTATTCEHCAAGCQLRADHRHFQVSRRLAADTPEVNEQWLCDKGRFAFVSARGDDRVNWPLIRENGELRVASWPEALRTAAVGLKTAGDSVGVLTGGRLTVENAYAYSRFARAVLGVDNIDFRTRPASAEEAEFLAVSVAGRRLGDGVSYADLEAASRVVLIGLEPEDEAPIVFLRLRKAVRKKGLKVVTVAALRSRGSRKLDAELVAALPGLEAAVLDGLNLDADTVVLVGERAALMPGLLGALAGATARVAWVPRRAGDPGAVEAGCLPGLLPGGRPLADQAARAEVEAIWGPVPSHPGLDASGMLDAASAGALRALVVGGAEPADFRSAAKVSQALRGAGFIVCLESRFSDIAQEADVVLPVALVEEQAGTFQNWEHRPGKVGLVNEKSAALPDLRVLAALADALGKPLGLKSTAQAATELAALGSWGGQRPAMGPLASRVVGELADADFFLATWRQLIDFGRGQDGEENLAATARPSAVRLNQAAAAKLGVGDGGPVLLSGPDGSVRLPIAIDDSVMDGVCWAPANSPGSVMSDLGAVHGSLVALQAGGIA